MTDPKTQFSKTIEKYRGLFTHIYAACGYLDKNEPEFYFENLPNNTDIFDLASLTKALVTAPLVEEVFKNTNLKLKNILKASPYSEPLMNLSLEDLLTHKSGLPAWANFWVCFIDKNHSQPEIESHIDTVLNRQVLSKDKSYKYSDVGYILLQRVLELYTQKSFAQIYKEFKIENKLNILHIKPRKSRSIKTAHCLLRNKDLVGEVHDENAAALGGFCGHAGAFANGPELIDYLKFLILNKKHLRSDWPKRENIYIGHLGFTGTAYWVDPNNLFYQVILTNRVISRRVSQQMPSFREEVYSFFDNIKS